MTGMEFAALFVVEVGALGVGRLHTKIASSKNLDDQHDILFKDMEVLLAINNDKEREVQRNNHKDTTNAYKLWTNRILGTAEEVQKLIVEKKSDLVRELFKDECLRDFLVDKPPEPVLKELNVPQISRYPTLKL